MAKSTQLVGGDTRCCLISLAVLCLVTTTWAIKLPTCSVQFGKTETPCFIFQQTQDCCSLDYILTNNESVIPHHITAKRGTIRTAQHKVYTPAYILFPYSKHINNEFVLMLHHEIPDAPQLCWNVQLTNNTRRYDKAMIKFVLRTDYVDGWTASTYGQDECAFTFNETDIETKNLECERFQNTTTIFKATSSRRELEFHIAWNHSIPLQLQVHVLSAPHNITCSGEVNSGLVDAPVAYLWTNVSETWRKNVSIGYHCLTISLENNQECVIYTETTAIENLRYLPPVQFTLSQLPALLLAGAICSVCVAALLVVAYRHRNQFQFRRKIVTTIAPAAQTQLLAANIKLLLLYSRDSKPFCHLVQAFRGLLELVHDEIEVIDVFDVSQYDTITHNSEVWLSDLLYSPHVTVVFVNSEGATLRQSALAHGCFVSKDPHCLDTVFTSALNHLRNPQLSDDYRRLFLVRLEDLPYDKALIGITPFRCFKILQHFDTFCTEITRMSSLSILRTPDYQAKYSQRVEVFKSALEAVKQLRQENPSYVREQWYFNTIQTRV